MASLKHVHRFAALGSRQLCITNSCLTRSAHVCGATYTKRNFSNNYAARASQSQTWKQHSWSHLGSCNIQRLDITRHHALYGLAGVRWKGSSTKDAAATPPQGDGGPSASLPEGYIPEPPPIPVPEPDAITDIANQVNALGEPTLQAMGLGSYWPSGLVQHALEFLHVSLDVPWWGAIMIGTVIVRICLFPLVIKSQQNAANMANNMPTMTRLQERFTQARTSGDMMATARAANELKSFMDRNDVNPLKSMMVPMAQLPIFISVFVGLRQMANLPVESMKAGGLFWFTDLTIPDPIYAMPVLTMATFLLTIELGVDGVKAGTMSHTTKWVMRVMPFVILPFMINFPSALLCYWFTTNIFSLGQVMLLKIPSLRAYCNIPQLVKHDESKIPMPKKKGFVEGFKDSWSNSKMINEIEDRQRMDAVKFKEAGMGPLVKTYPYDPTKVKKVAPPKKS